MLSCKIDTFFEADARPFARIKYLYPFLHKDGLQKHLGCVLHMKQDASSAAIIIARVERGYRPAK